MHTFKIRARFSRLYRVERKRGARMRVDPARLVAIAGSGDGTRTRGETRPFSPLYPVSAARLAAI